MEASDSVEVELMVALMKDEKEAHILSLNPNWRELRWVLVEVKLIFALMEGEQEAGEEPGQAEVDFPISDSMCEEAREACDEERECGNSDDHAGAQALVLAHRAGRIHPM